MCTACQKYGHNLALRRCRMKKKECATRGLNASRETGAPLWSRSTLSSTRTVIPFDLARSHRDRDRAPSVRASEDTPPCSFRLSLRLAKNYDLLFGTQCTHSALQTVCSADCLHSALGARNWPHTVCNWPHTVRRVLLHALSAAHSSDSWLARAQFVQFARAQPARVRRPSSNINHGHSAAHCPPLDLHLHP